ncbi:CrcB family protein, partial [Bifidobacterium bifidum]
MNQSVPFVPSSHDESDGGDAAGAGDIESVSAGSDVADTSAPDSTPSEAHALAADEPAPSTQEISASEIEYSAPRPTGLAAAVAPPSIPLAPAKRVQAKFNPLADGMLYLVVFVGGFFGTAIRYGLSLLLPNPAAPSGLLHSFHTATFIANMLACFIFAALSTYMSQAAWIRKRIRQLVSRGVGMG